jgi:hypothetical protein
MFPSLQYPTIDAGIAQFEGFQISGSVAQRNNNPGNLQFGSFAQKYGANGADGSGFARFDSPDAGFTATDALVSSYAARGFSLTDLVNTWNPPTASGNSYQGNQNYTSFLAQKTGLNPNMPIAAQTSGGLLYSIGGGLFGGAFPSLNGASLFGSIIPDSLNPIKAITSQFSWSRVAAFLLGVLFIAGGLFMLKPVQEIVIRSGKKMVESGAETIAA